MTETWREDAAGLMHQRYQSRKEPMAPPEISPSGASATSASARLLPVPTHYSPITPGIATAFEASQTG